MAFSFDEIERLAHSKLKSRSYLEAALMYENLERAAISELGSDQARFYCISNQATCLFHAGRVQDALAKAKAAISFFNSKINGFSAVAGSDVVRYDAVNNCFYNHMVISSHLPGYVHPRFEPPLEQTQPYFIGSCSSPEG